MGASRARRHRMTGSAGRAVARTALLIAALTLLGRLAGFGRIFVFGHTVGPTCLGDTYQAINSVPNIAFEIVAGGALAGLVIPLLAGGAAGGDRQQVRDGASALLSWTLLVLIPLAVIIAVFAEPLTRLLLGHKADCGADAVRVGAAMLRVFAPQIPLYGLGVVLTGVLQTSRRFGGPALAPLLSSLVVIAAYLAYAWQAPGATDIGNVSRAEQLTLSVGTTLGVVVLTLSLAVPLTRTGLRLRPLLRFPAGMARPAARLAGAGMVGLLAQQVAVAVTLILGNGAGVPAGRMTSFVFAQTVFLLPWGVLAVPIATSVFPQLTTDWAAGDRNAYARLVAQSVRGVLLACALSAAALVAIAGPVARLLVAGAPGPRSSATAIAAGITALAPGLLGYGLFALLSRCLYAQGGARRTATATLAGWLAVAVADLGLAQAFPARDRVVALAIGNSIGMTVLGGLLVLAMARSSGRPAFAGVARTTAGALAGA
ncbi:MAG: virulence factor MviN, partial [Actinomycetota bacterium]|nr:virulence factor MviN [Actinomycetota bacterium]